MVGAIGGGMAMGAAMGPAAGAGPVGNVGAADAGAAGAGAGADGNSVLPSNPMTSAPTMSMSQLADFLKDFSSAEILIALMMASGGRGHSSHKKDDSSDAGMALLAGFALGQAMNSMGNSLGNACNPGQGGGVAATMGSMLNVTV